MIWRVTGAISSSEAEDFSLIGPGGWITLRELLVALAVPRTVDTNADSVPDAWALSFVATGVEAELMGDLGDAVGRFACP